MSPVHLHHIFSSSTCKYHWYIDHTSPRNYQKWTISGYTFFSFVLYSFIFPRYFFGLEHRLQALLCYIQAWKKRKLLHTWYTWESLYILFFKRTLYIPNAYTIPLLVQVKPLCWSLPTSFCRRIHLLPYFNPSLYNGIIFFIHTVFIVQQDAKQNFTLLMCEIVELQNIKTKTSKSKHMNPPFVVYMMLKLPVVLLTWSPALSSDIGWSFDNGCILP